MSNASKLAYIILTMAVGYVFIFPSVGEVSDLMAEKQQYSDSLVMVNNIENKKNELLTQFNKISVTDKKDIDTILPSSLDFVSLIYQINTVAERHNISVNKTSLKEAVVSNGQSTGDGAPQKPYQSAIVGFSFKTSYENFNAFLDDLEKSLRILDIKSIKLGAGENGVYTYDIEFETYWLK